jgi:glycosyltransferase involved in cell wall biosynthesis
MKIAMIHDAGVSLENGGVFSSVVEYNMTRKFLEFFDSAVMVGVGKKRRKRYVKIDYPGIDRVYTVPYIGRPKGFFKFPFAIKTIKKAVLECDVVYCRGYNGVIAQRIAKKNGKKTLAFVGGCVYTGLRAGSFIQSLAAGIVKKIFQRSIAETDVVMYCSSYLKKTYPNNKKTVCWTEVHLPEITDEVVKKRKEKIDNTKDKITLGLIGFAHNRIKGVDTAIEALAQLGGNYRLLILGTGDNGLWNEKIKKLNVADRVEFCSYLVGENAVAKWLDSIDIYIQPSRTEGLPKATIEAMARGCPVISSEAGGLPDIVRSDFVHKIGDSKKLAEMIKALSGDKALMHEMSQHSFKQAEKFEKERLDMIFADVCNYIIKGDMND